MCNSSNALLYYYDDAVFYNSVVNFCPAFGTFAYVTLISSSLKVSTRFSAASFKVGFICISLSVF